MNTETQNKQLISTKCIWITWQILDGYKWHRWFCSPCTSMGNLLRSVITQLTFWSMLL